MMNKNQYYKQKYDKIINDEIKQKKIKNKYAYLLLNKMYYLKYLRKQKV